VDHSAPDLAEFERALVYAHRAIARREQTVREVRDLLERRGIGPPTIQAAVDELRSTGLLDDARFARRFAGDKRDLEQWGARRITSELERRGVDSEEVAAVIERTDRSGEMETALVLLERRLPRAPRDDRERDRAWRLLVRRGYEPELAYEAVREHARAWAAGGPDTA
jgi:regulatory protein